MKKFSDLNISTTTSSYLGQAIKIFTIFNKDIEIHKFKVEPSKKNDSILLTIQIKIQGENRIIFCGSKNLKEILEKVPVNDFPFSCQIINTHSGYSIQ